MERIVEIFSFRGRVNRARYVWEVLAHGAMLAFTTRLLLMFVPLAAVVPFMVVFFAVMWCAVAWPALAAVVKRLHDLDRPGWHALLLLVPVYGLVLFVVTLAAAGTDGDNRYGRDPLADPGKLELAP